MRVEINQNHLKLNDSLARQINQLSARFDNKNYSKIGNIDRMLLEQDVSVEKKKQLLIKNLHELAVKTFSINKKKFSGRDLGSLKKRLHNLRRIIIRLRGINHYLETIFLEEISFSKIKINKSKPKIHQGALAKEELEVLEYSAYNLIGKVVMLDKRLLKEYSQKEEKIIRKEKTEIKGIDLILRKETAVMEHLEAKIPPPNDAGMDLLKEPLFSHWVARVFALLAYLEFMHNGEKEFFRQLKKNKSIKSKIDRKILSIVREKSKLLRIMEEKVFSMGKINISGRFKKEFRSLAAAVRM